MLLNVVMLSIQMLVSAMMNRLGDVGCSAVQGLRLRRRFSEFSDSVSGFVGVCVRAVRAWGSVL